MPTQTNGDVGRRERRGQPGMADGRQVVPFGGIGFIRRPADKARMATIACVSRMSD